MLARIIFCVVIAAAVLVVVLLATVSPLPHRSGGGHKGAPGQRTLTVYIHPTVSAPVVQQEQQVQERRRGVSALVFHHRMTAGPESTSTTVGAASGFLLPAGERGAAASVFDTVHLAFDGGAGLSGSLCVETSDEKARRGGRRRHDGEEEVLRVVGGTGAFAFARGHAVLRGQRPRPGATAAALLLELSVSSAESY
ncbi:dirigent protein 21-like [Miscanthus floridulus]|uniref:dirigent protein 21-like n=1 Tax=Miscanthus floridulus TaxID=154761 RepID=UPI0034585B12